MLVDATGYWCQQKVMLVPLQRCLQMFDGWGCMHVGSVPSRSIVWQELFVLKHESMRDSLHHNCHDGNQHLFKQYPTGFYSSIQNKNKNGQLPRTGRGWERERRRRRPNSRGAEAAAIGSSRQTYVKRNFKPLYLNSEEFLFSTHGSRDTGCTTLCLLTATAAIPADSRCCLYQHLC